MTRILLARHGETDWNEQSRWQGHSDRPLNETGREQARALAGELADTSLAAVYSSDLLRAYETARVVADAKGLDVTATPALREVNVGTWEGLTWDEIEHRFPEGYRRHRAYEGVGWDAGETHEDMAERVLSELHAIAAAHPGDEQVLVVTHGGPIRAVIAHTQAVPHLELRRQRVAVDNCSVSRIAVEDGRFTRLD